MSTKNSIKRTISALAAGVLGAAVMAFSPITASAELTGSAASFMRGMGAGWNLGNSLDANEADGQRVTGLGSETCWSNPKTTKAMIKKVHDAGFNSIRIPVSWANHMDADYQIDSAWMARVKEVVDYAYDEGMYVIINTHHDNLRSWENLIGYYPDNAHKTASLKYVTKAWTQISDEFKSYGDRLIFETLNEPRLRGTGSEWWFRPDSPNDAEKEAMAVINELNQKAVDTIRSTGGNNTTRYIMVPAYVASHFNALGNYFTLPRDPITTNKNRIAVSVHAYRPYELCLAGDKRELDSTGKKELDDIFADLDRKYLSKGIPVVIGEMGISDKDNSAVRREWARYYYALGKKYTVPCLLWDNNAGRDGEDGERHGHLDRVSLTWRDAGIIEAIMSVMGSPIAHETLYGDVNSSGNVNDEDLSRLQQFVSSWKVTIDQDASDVNGDGVVDDNDLARLQQYLSGWKVPLGKK